MATVRTKMFLVPEIIDTTRDACARPATEIENQNVNQIFAKNHEKEISIYLPAKAENESNQIRNG